MRGPLIWLCAACAALAALSGCGNDRPARVSSPPAPSDRSQELHSSRDGLTVKLPANLDVSRDVLAPAVFRATLGEPFVSGYAYRRKEQLPGTDRELADARKRLARVVRRRDPDYRLGSAHSTRIDGARAVELVGEQTLSRRRVTVRSLHVFKGQAEYVIEIVAPRAQFARFDRGVTPMIKRTLDVTGRVRAGKR